MPYYREEFVNSERPVSTWRNGSLVNSSTMVRDSATVMSFRSRPHPRSVRTTSISDIAADPYAYFLESTSRRKYHDRLRERGLQPSGDPDRGHTFELSKHIDTGLLHDVTRTATAFGVTETTVYNGARVLLVPPTGALDTIHAGRIGFPAPYKETGLDAFAQQAYARSAPDSVVFDAALFLGELREGLPRLVPELLQGSAGILKRAGSDYLNVEFGWKPLISDLQNAGRALLGATDMLSREGTRVHRRYSLPPLREFGDQTLSGTASILIGNTKGVLTNQIGSETGFGTTTSSTMSATGHLSKSRSSRRWFEGEFSSFYPLGFDPTDYMQRLSVLLNPKITPSTLWELAPWSWLVDWNLRIGDTIRANEMNANDLLVMHYGYAMEHTVYTTEVSWRATAGTTGTTKWDGLPIKGGYFSTTQYKRRLRANPYGFRVGGSGSLTGGQAAILGALGLTKLK